MYFHYLFLNIICGQFSLCCIFNSITLSSATNSLPSSGILCKANFLYRFYVTEGGRRSCTRGLRVYFVNCLFCEVWRLLVGGRLYG